MPAPPARLGREAQTIVGKCKGTVSGHGAECFRCGGAERLRIRQLSVPHNGPMAITRSLGLPYEHPQGSVVAPSESLPLCLYPRRDLLKPDMESPARKGPL